MILNDIKQGITEALYKADNSINVYFEDVKTVSFPFCKVCLVDFKSEAVNTKFKTKCLYTFKIVSMKSSHNTLFELMSMHELIKNALIPCVKVKNKKVTLEDPIFRVSEDKLLFDFKISFYEIEDDETEMMQILDITVKENKNAR